MEPLEKYLQFDPLEFKLASVAAIGAAVGVLVGALIVLAAVRSARARAIPGGGYPLTSSPESAGAAPGGNVAAIRP